MMAKSSFVAVGDSATAEQYNLLREDVRLPEDVINVNLIRNYPSLEGADGIAPEWWSTSNATLTEEDATGEGLSGAPNERVLKVVTSAVNGIIFQNFLYSDESLLFDGRSHSGGFWVYVVTPGTVTFSLAGSGTWKQDTTTTTGEWVWLEVDDRETSGSSLAQFRIGHSASGATFYVANPTLNVGSTVMPWKPRGLRLVSDVEGTGVLAVNPADTSWHDLDLTTYTSNLAVMVELITSLGGGPSSPEGYIRRNGSSEGQTNATKAAHQAGDEVVLCTVLSLMDDGQLVEYSVDNSAASDFDIWLKSFYEWE